MNGIANSHTIILIFFMCAVTYLPKLLPLFFLSGRRLPLWMEEWLGFIPIAILSAIITPLLIVNGDTGHVVFLNREVVVAIPTFVFALKTKSIGFTVLIGMALYWLLGRFPVLYVMKIYG